MNSYKKIFLIFTVFFTGIITFSDLYSQSVVWRQIIGGPRNDESYNCIELNDGGYVATGYKLVKPIGSEFYIAKAFIIKFDRLGNILWDKIIGDSLTASISYTIAEDSLGNIYLPYKSNIGIQLAKFDLNGNLLWEKNYSSYSILYFRGVSFTDNYKNLVLLSLNNTLNPTSAITKVDSSGNLIWTKSFYDSIPSISVYTSQNNSFFFSDNSYYICGSKGKGFIIKTDTNGNIIWNKRYLDNLGIYSIAQNSENTFLAAGDSKDLTSLYCMEFDSSGTVIWTKNYNNDTLARSIGSDGIIKNFDNNFVLGTTHTDNVGRLLIIDSIGNILSSKYYYYPPGFYINQNNTNITSDSGYIIAGSLDSDNVLCNYQIGGKQLDILVFKTDKYGKTVSIFNNQTEVSEVQSLNVYPNPYNLSFNINFDINRSSDVRIILYDISGRMVKQILNRNLGNGNYKFTINTPELSSGVYFIKTAINDKSITKRILLIK